MASTEPARLLIVDDEVRQMRALCDTLRDDGYVTMGYAKPAEALEALRAQRFDLLMTDLVMPEIDGLTLLRAALEIDPDLVVVMITAHGTVNSAVEAMKAGAIDYVLKPFKLSAIRPVLARALTLRKLRLENEALAHSLRERTRALELANKELEAFAHSVSHDLQSPIRSINGFLGMLLEESGAELSERERHLLAQIGGAATALSEIIEGLLRFSRAGRQSLVQAPVDVEALAKDALRTVVDQHPGRRVETQVAQLPSASADKALLRQVFANLLSNAFKFTAHTANPLVEIGFIERDGRTVYFVRDNGAGFDMRYADKLFGVFERLHASSEYPGTGIGLSIVQRIVERHGGRIWAEGAVGRGATFCFTLENGGDDFEATRPIMS